MNTLQTIKKHLLIIASYIKNYWWVVVFGGVSIWIILFAKNKAELLEQLTEERETISLRHRQEIEQLNRIHANDVAERVRIESEYRATIVRINQTHSEALDNLSKIKKQELRDIIAETNNNPELMAARVNSLFGFQVLPSNNTNIN